MEVLSKLRTLAKIVWDLTQPGGKKQFFFLWCGMFLSGCVVCLVVGWLVLDDFAVDGFHFLLVVVIVVVILFLIPFW